MSNTTPSTVSNVSVPSNDKAGWNLVEQYAAAPSKLLGNRTVLIDTVALSSSSSSSSTSITGDGSLEYAFGQVLVTLQQRTHFVDRITNILATPGKKLAPQTIHILTKWLETRSNYLLNTDTLAFADQWFARDGAFDKDIQYLYDNRSELVKPSLWIAAKDGWNTTESNGGTQIGGIHHILASNEDINVIVFVSDPAHDNSPKDLQHARRDVGLYALNYGNAYVASVAPTVNPDQYEQAIKEADAFPGPSVLLVFTPVRTANEIDDARSAVESGRWPLYRYDPSKDSSSTNYGFSLDSEKLRDDITAFLDRNAHLSLLTNTEPSLPSVLTSSIDKEEGIRQAQAETKLKGSFDRLMGALTLPPLVILFGSDGGNAENIAKRLGNESRTKGFTDITVKAMDYFPLETLPTTPLVFFVVSTAGQGEFPMNARQFWKQLSVASIDLSSIQFAVFGLGDSNYWPRKEQLIFFNKASADLDAQLSKLGGVRLLERGIGNDQDVGGYQTGFRSWLPQLWTSLGIGSPNDQNTESTRVRNNEDIKKTSNFLRGTILQGLADTSTGALTYEDTQLTKFHGIYQQDDRDLRGDRKRKGLEPAYSFMVRVRIPGGVCTPAQYLALDHIADTHANGTIRATTRQAVQFHGIIKGLLKPGIAAINRALMDTLAACGDVNRNVMCTANPEEGIIHAATLDFTRRLSAHLSPRTSAYHEIWLDEKLVAGGSDDIEPIYGKEYLPRKFKIGVAVPPNNDVDVYTQDLSFVAVPNATGDQLLGFNVLVGGGMGMTHNNPKTYPRLAEDLCYVPLDKAIAVAEAVVTTQRDYGDRTNRKHARLKYTIDDRGIEWFRTEVEQRIGIKLEPTRPYAFKNNADRLGWIQSNEGTWGYTLFIQNGRIKDDGNYRLKTGLKSIAEKFPDGAEFRFTSNQNLMLAKIQEKDKAFLDSLFVEYGIENRQATGLRLNSMACVALPTCGLALAESERYLPSLISKLDTVLEENGLHDDAITIRMTGCPNGCARPFVAEIGFVGRSPGIYNLYLGAGHSGERLNKLYKEGLDETQILQELQPIIKRYALERTGKEEHFGDWVIRAGIIKPTLSGRTFHEL